jgi:hypothetical protein
MKVTVVPAWETGKWQARVKQGVQSFDVGVARDSKEEAQWFAKMFRLALRNHDKEKQHGKI